MPYLELRFITAVGVVVGATTTTCWQRIPMGWVGSVGVATVPDRIEHKALQEQPIPAVVVVVAMRKARAERADPAW